MSVLFLSRSPLGGHSKEGSSLFFAVVLLVWAAVLGGPKPNSLVRWLRFFPCASWLGVVPSLLFFPFAIIRGFAFLFFF